MAQFETKAREKLRKLVAQCEIVPHPKSSQVLLIQNADEETADALMDTMLDAYIEQGKEDAATKAYTYSREDGKAVTRYPDGREIEVWIENGALRERPLDKS